MRPSDFSDEFPLDPGLIYLNHAAVSPWPRRTAEAVKRFAEENLHQGGRDYPRWLETETRLREQCRSLLNAPSADDIALLKNTSKALSVVTHRPSRRSSRAWTGASAASNAAARTCLVFMPWARVLRC